MRVIITQRVDHVEGRAEKRDALDQAWSVILPNLLGCDVTILPLANIPAHAARTLELLAPNLILLSGGNDIGISPERDSTEEAVLEYAQQRRVPVLGVCRGMQFMQHYLGGVLINIEGHVATQHSIRARDGSELIVNSYHRFGITKLAAGLNALYTHADGSIEAAQHESLPWLAVMWHPERVQPPEANLWLAHQLKVWL